MFRFNALRMYLKTVYVFSTTMCRISWPQNKGRVMLPLRAVRKRVIRCAGARTGHRRLQRLRGRRPRAAQLVECLDP